MKPCLKNRQPIALLALDSLDTQTATELRAHLAHCEGCRQYSEEISTVTKGLASVAPDSNLEASESFHHRVAAKLQPAESPSTFSHLTVWLRGTLLNWRVALPAGAVLVIALVVTIAPHHPPTVSPPTAINVQVESASHSETDLAPTIANYQMAASQSLEKFSDLLTQQGNKPLPPAPLYTISGFKLSAGSN